MKRLSMLSVALSAIITVAGCSSSNNTPSNNTADADSPASKNQKRPNILLIVSDDVGYADTQPFGG